MTDMIEQAGLRERKKARTRASLREHAIRLFREQGYEKTTVEQIAAAAEVSPSTFFRYFPTKEDVVLQDDMDVRMLAALAAQPADQPPITAIRAAFHEALGSFSAAEVVELSEAAMLTLTVPEIRARAMDEFSRTIDVIAGAIAERAGRSPDDLAVRAMAGAVVGVIMSIVLPLKGTSTVDQSMPVLFERVDEALALLEAGLPLLGRRREC
jgi:AcrR family transcriptional regulator